MARRAGPVAAAAALLALLTGCGSAAPPGGTLTIYELGPLRGPAAVTTHDAVAGANLALARAGGHAGPFTLNVRVVDDGDEHGVVTRGTAAAAARFAASDPSAIAVLADGSAAGAPVTIPLANEAGLPVLAPATAAGLEAAPLYPTGQRTFVRSGGDAAGLARARRALARRPRCGRCLAVAVPAAGLRTAVAAAFARTYGRPATPAALLAEQAAAAVVAAVRGAGPHGADRGAVTAALTRGGGSLPVRWVEARLRAGRIVVGSPL